MSNIATQSAATELVTEARVVGTGATAVDRKLSIVQAATASTLMALSATKGKVGNVARAGLANEGLGQLARHAANAHYRPLAEFLAVQLDLPIVISSRATFESLPCFIESLILSESGKKSQGLKKDGTPTPKLANLIGAKAFLEECIAHAAKVHAERQAAKAIEAAKEAA